RPINVRVEQANFVAELRQRQRQIHGNRGLAHAAFAARDGNKIFHARNRLAFRLLHWCWAWWHVFSSTLETVIPNGASRCLFLPIRSCESVGSRSEVLFGIARFSRDESLFDLR